MQFGFIVGQVDGYRKILKLSYRSLAFTSYKAFFKKNKKRPGTSFPLPFSVWFLNKNICLVIFDITWPNFIVWLPLLREILSSMPIVIACYPRCDVINFEVNFIIKPFFDITKGKIQKFKYPENKKGLPFTVCISLSVSLHNQKIRTKMQMPQERKELLTWNKKHFSSFLKGSHWSKHNNLFRRWEYNFKLGGWKTWLDHCFSKYWNINIPVNK